MGASGFHDRLADVLGDFVKARDPLDQGDIVERASRKGYTLTQSSVSRWINGAMPRIEAAEGLAAALEVTPEWLAFGRGQKRIAEPLRRGPSATREARVVTTAEEAAAAATPSRRKAGKATR